MENSDRVIMLLRSVAVILCLPSSSVTYKVPHIATLTLVVLGETRFDA